MSANVSAAVASRKTCLRPLSSVLRKHVLSNSPVGDLPWPIVDVRYAIGDDGRRTGTTVISYVSDAEIKHAHLPKFALENKDVNALLEALVDRAFDRFDRTRKGLTLLCSLLIAARDKDCFVLDREGFHTLRDTSGVCTVHAYDGELHSFGGSTKIPAAVCTATPDYRKKAGDADKWRRCFEPILSANPLVLFPTMAALATPIFQFLERPSIVVHIAGRSSTSKSAALLVARSTYSADPKLRDCSGTPIGILEALAAWPAEAPFLDETHRADDPLTLKAIAYAGANQSPRLVSARAGPSTVPTQITGNPILAGERPLATCLPPSERFDLGLDARLIEIGPHDRFGMLRQLPKGLTAAAFADSLKRMSAATGGNLFKAWIQTLSQNHGRFKTWSLQAIPKIKAELVRDLDPADAVGHRQADGVAVIVFAGQLATKLELWNISKDTCLAAGIEAVRQGQHARGGRNGTATSEAVEALRDLLEAKRSLVIPFSNYHSIDKQVVGYEYSHIKEGELLLLLGSALSSIEKQFGKEAFFQSLDQAGFLVKNEGFKLQVRLPKNRNGDRERRSFYAIRKSILAM